MPSPRQALPPSSPPHYSTIQNTTCVLAPEVIEGPYYINNEYLRTEIRENQQGVHLLMDFGVMDTATCKPMPDALVEIWHANSTGIYGGFGYPEFDGHETWLRGGWPTDANGMMEMSTIYPSFYDDRPPHIHLMVHKDIEMAPNGTFISHTGTIMHVAQVFFPDDWSDKVFDTYPYTTNPYSRTLNKDDEFYPIAESAGYKATIDIQYLEDEDITKGLVGYLTLGVDTTATYTINHGNYSW